ncbi:hypothetical protein TorRG33x02_304870 [Trema orientale]|uniref:Uncharacterized protein n=1 Tax=Trema orientale TaxID=63057 RepID=A0A2P5BXU9_TREOI|nr:hypothetical protein TorRG33x02_304870 [Trema orientale]
MARVFTQGSKRVDPKVEVEIVRSVSQASQLSASESTVHPVSSPVDRRHIISLTSIFDPQIRHEISPKLIRFGCM